MWAVLDGGGGSGRYFYWPTLMVLVLSCCVSCNLLLPTWWGMQATLWNSNLNGRRQCATCKRKWAHQAPAWWNRVKKRFTTPPFVISLNNPLRKFVAEYVTPPRGSLLDDFASHHYSNNSSWGTSYFMDERIGAQLWLVLGYPKRGCSSLDRHCTQKRSCLRCENTFFHVN